MPSFISIPNVIGNFFGGQPYNIDLQINFDGPSTLKIQVFNETGDYGTPNPNYSAVQTITIGTLQFVGFLVEYTMSEEASSRIMTLEYEDCSSLLDKKYVGLHKRHGLNPDAGTTGTNSEYFIDSTGSTADLIIVGREILKTGVNYGGYSSTHIHDVGYTFNELLAKLGVGGVSIPNVNYLRDYSGNLREVLSSWCSDYGLMYYWEFGASTLQGGLRFFDLKNIITISDSIVSNCNITDKTIRVSARGTLGSGEVAYYEREGGPLSVGYNIPPKILNLRCLTLIDLYGEGEATEALNIATSLAYYSQALRDLYFWFNYRKIDGPTKLQSMNNSELTEFGLSNVVHVSSFAIEQGKFDTIKEFGSEGDTIGEKAEKLSAIHGFPYYFFVAKYNEEIYKAKLEGEIALANNFLGKHWLRSFDVSGKNPNASVSSPGDMQCEYIDHLAVVPSLEFADFGHTPSSFVGGLVQQGKAGGISLTRSMIYGQRGGVWYPNQNNIKDYESLFAYYDAMAHRFFDSSYDRLFNDLGLDTSIVNQSNGYQLFIAFQRQELPVTRSVTNHFLDQTAQTPVFSADQNNTIIGNYGLRANNCYYITFDGFNFMVPCGGLSFGENPSVGGSYDVRVGDDQFGSFSATTKKIQYTNRNIPSMNGVAKCNVNFNTVSGDDISQTRPQVKATSQQEQDTNDSVNVADVRGYVQNVLSQSVFTQTQNSRYIEFTLAGLPINQARISDGLDSLSIQVGENGVFTQYAYSDKLIKAQEAMELRRLKSAVTNYNHMPRRYMSMLEGSAAQNNQFIQPT
jgi:hypothetical protein